MFTYRINRALAVLVGAAAFASFFGIHHSTLPEFRAALLLYSSILIAAISYFAQRNLVGQARYSRFGALLLLTSVGIYITFLTSNLLALGIGWTSSGLGAALLVNHANDFPSRKASRTIGSWFLVSDLALWGAIALSHFNHVDPWAALGAIKSTPLTILIGALFALAGVIRSGLLPAMRWLILTIEAPTPLSALLHAGIVNGFGYLLVALPIIQKDRSLVVIIGLLTIIASLSVMRHRHDEKGKLANGTSMQMAFMALEGVLGIPGIVLLHIAGHGSYKSWSFLRAGGAPLRRKNAMPIDRSNESNKTFSALLAVLYGATVAFGIWWLGRDYLLNISVGAIALASIFVFAGKLNLRLALQTITTGVLGFAFYLGVLKLFSNFFAYLWKPSLSLIITISAAILVMTAIFRFVPRNWTLRFASWINHYRLRSDTVKSGLIASSKVIQNGATDLLERVEVAGSPFIAGGALSEIVAQDSLAGLHHLDYGAAADIAAGYGISMYQSSEQYLELLESGVITRTALEESAVTYGAQVDQLISLTKADAFHNEKEYADKAPNKVATHSSWWSSQAWFNGGNSHPGGAYSLWHQSLNSKIASLLPSDPQESLATSLAMLETRYRNSGAPTTSISLLQGLIAVDISWYIFVKGLGKDSEISLLALRAALALAHGEDILTRKAKIAPQAEIWQTALEASFASEFEASLNLTGGTSLDRQSNEIGIVTCIDVRSDLLRQRAEELNVRTYGMAGFFGVDICLTSKGKSHKKLLNFAPVILQPSIALSDSREESYTWALPIIWKKATSGTGALAIAEGFGLMNGLLNLLNTFLPWLAHRINSHFDAPRWMGATGADPSLLSLDQKIAYASNITSILKLDGIKELIFVGHGADASNTPFRSMYECGACGGNNGLLNARFAANLMNDPEVQRHLSSIYGEASVRFYAAEHNTTLGTLKFDPNASSVMESEGSSALRSLRSRISTLPRRDYPGSPTFVSPVYLKQRAAVAWWQVFPEWGLSSNAACVIGPRSLTYGANLGSRVFLHDYDWREDHDSSILNTILSGPGVVMQMINFAYNMAVSDPQKFSSGDKTRHNVLGEAGVLLGSDGPLYRGLPWQSISTSALAEPRSTKGHLPIRLQFYIAAPQQFIDEVVDNSSLAELARGGWIAIHSIGNNS